MLTFLCELSWPVQAALVVLLCFAALKIYSVLIKGVCRSPNRLDGKTVIITGANTGIGKETALDLAKRGARVLLACRDVSKASTAKDDIVRLSGNANVEIRHLDLASLSSVRKFATGILESESRLDVLINNAGCAGYAKRELTEDGLEYQMQANYFGHFLLTSLLLGLLKKSAPSRVINVSSIAHVWAKELDFNNLNSEKSYDPSNIYNTSKLCQVLSTRHLAPLVINSGVTVNCLHPGCVETGIFQRAPLWLVIPAYIFVKLIFKDWKEGAQTSIHLAVSNEGSRTTGQYFSDCKVDKMSTYATDEGVAKKLWESSELLVKLEAKERHY